MNFFFVITEHTKTKKENFKYIQKGLYTRIKASYKSMPKRCSLGLDIKEGIDCLFRSIRTGMQWRELQIKSVSYTSLFKHVQRWIFNIVSAPSFTKRTSQY